MGNYKVDNYFNEQFGKLWKESREQRAFDLGYANGMFQLYKYLVETESIDDADRIFEPIAKSNEHFKKYVELYKDKESEAEKMAAVFKRKKREN